MDRIAGASGFVAGMALIGMLVLLNLEAAYRYFLGGSTLIADEYGAYLLIAMTFLGFPVAARNGALLRVGMLVDPLGPGARRWLGLLSDLLGAGLAAVVVLYTWRYAGESLMFNSVSNQPSRTPLVYPQAFIPLGVGLLGMVFLQRAWARLAGRPVTDAGS